MVGTRPRWLARLPSGFYEGEDAMREYAAQPRHRARPVAKRSGADDSRGPWATSGLLATETIISGEPRIPFFLTHPFRERGSDRTAVSARNRERERPGRPGAPATGASTRSLTRAVPCTLSH